MPLIFNPRQTVLVTCHGRARVIGREEEFDDILPLDWHSPASMEPGVYAIFISAKLPAAELIRSSRAFCVNFMPFSAADKIAKAGRASAGAHLDKFVATKLHRKPCEKLTDCPRIAEALGWLECELLEEKPIGDHILFLGTVVRSELPQDGSRPFHLDGTKFTTTKEF